MDTVLSPYRVEGLPSGVWATLSQSSIVSGSVNPATPRDHVGRIPAGPCHAVGDERIARAYNHPVCKRNSGLVFQIAIRPVPSCKGLSRQTSVQALPFPVRKQERLVRPAEAAKFKVGGGML